MDNKELVEFSYRKPLNLLTIQGWFFRNTNLDAQCIENIAAHFKTEKKLTIIIKAELIDAQSFSSFSKLISYLNLLSKNNEIEIQIKWISSNELMSTGQRLKLLAKFPFFTFTE